MQRWLLRKTTHSDLIGPFVRMRGGGVACAGNDAETRGAQKLHVWRSLRC